LRVYHWLPPPARSVAATLQGLHLRWWRYGRGSEGLMREARDRESWSVEQWNAWQQERLAFILHRAATRVPHYRDQWSARRRRGDRASWELLEHWPVLEKEAVRQNPRAFVADDCSPRRMFHLRTSGTTGTPLDVWRSHATVKALYSLGMARTRGWHGMTLGHRRAMLGGQLVTPVQQRRPPFWVWNPALQQLYMSSYHLAPDLLPHYLDALVRYRIVYLAGYSSSICALAQEALRLGRRDLKMAVAITSAEPLLAHQREAIAEAFQCPVRETYGMSETVAEATECEAGRLHQWPEVGWIEVLEGERIAAKGASGELICTGLLNSDMPFIRYRVGDSGHLVADGAHCECGRTMPLLGGIDGRTNDLLVTRDGRRVFWLNPVLYGLPIREAQIVQETLDRVRVRYCPAPTFTEDVARTLTERLRSRMGDVQVILEEVDAVPRTANGKVRSVICNLPVIERGTGD
jgi:phenylacetate-CoA ligase